MATTTSFKHIIDLPMWRMESPTLAASAAGMCMANDMRNDSSRGAYIYFLRSATAFDCFDPTTGEWLALSSPALTGTFGAGAAAVFHASQGPRGTITAGATTTSVVLSTALPAAVGVNQLANKGNGIGYKIRIVDNASGASGKTEERYIIANTSGTTPTITVDVPFTFTPTSGSTYEILSGRVFLLSAGTLAAGMWKYYDIATNSYSSNLATANLPSSVNTDSGLISFSEQYVPNTRAPGEGFIDGSSTYNNALLSCVVATAATGTTITSSGLPASIVANEYSNFQVRIVEDTTTPTAVGQRRKITSHTSGATAVFTVPTWTTTPSATAKFVIENNDDVIMLKTSASATTYCYNITANAWDTSTFAANGGVVGAGLMMAHAFGITRDTTNNARHSHVFLFRGAASAVLDVYDIATNSWANAVDYGNRGTTFTIGSSGTYDPVSNGGRFLYININGTQRMARFDVRNRVLDVNSYLRYSQGNAIVGGKMGTCLFVDGETKITFLYHITNTLTVMLSLMIQT